MQLMAGGDVAASVRPQKRSFTIRGHRTSISLEAAFWGALREVAAGEGCSLAALVARIDGARGDTNLSSAVRVFVLEHYRRQARDLSSARPGTD